MICLICLSACPKSLAFGSHSLANFRPISDCFISNFKLKYEDSENVKADRVNTVVFTYIKLNVGRLFFCIFGGGGGDGGGTGTP